MNTRLILASNSARRRDLLTEAGVRFEAFVPAFDEEKYVKDDIPPQTSPEDISPALAVAKAFAAYDTLPAGENDIILAADTSVLLGDRIMGKPTDYADAVGMLSALQGNTHTVVTGVAVVYTVDGKRQLLADKALTLVTVQKLSAAEIDDYISTEYVYDKAGAYAIQGRAECFIDKICGSYSNVVGLPMGLVRKLLKKTGFI